jgi:hypothetical protein
VIFCNAFYASETIILKNHYIKDFINLTPPYSLYYLCVKKIITSNNCSIPYYIDERIKDSGFYCQVKILDNNNLKDIKINLSTQAISYIEEVSFAHASFEIVKQVIDLVIERNVTFACLKALDLWNVQIKYNQFAYINEFFNIKYCLLPNLTKIDLGWNQLSCYGFKILMASLSAADRLGKNLKCLYISSNLIMDESFLWFIELLQNDSNILCNLEEFDLSWNFISYSSFNDFFKILNTNPNITPNLKLFIISRNLICDITNQVELKRNNLEIID